MEGTTGMELYSVGARPASDCEHSDQSKNRPQGLSFTPESPLQ